MQNIYNLKISKYKQKTSELIKQIGGIDFGTMEVPLSKNFIAVRFASPIVNNTDFTNFLRTKVTTDVTSVFCHPNGKCMINFNSNADALKHISRIRQAIQEYDPSIIYYPTLSSIGIGSTSSVDMTRVPSRPSATSSSAVYGGPSAVYGGPSAVYGGPSAVYGGPSVITKPSAVYGGPSTIHTRSSSIPYVMPWDTDSNMLYISLVISPKSNIGQTIHSRCIRMGIPSPFGDYDGRDFKPSGVLLFPHLSFLQLFIKKDSNIDIGLSANLHDIVEQIKLLFEDKFRNSQIHSKYGEYETLGQWITRVYVDEPYMTSITGLYNVFLKDITNILPIYSGIPELSVKEHGIRPAKLPAKLQISPYLQTFTHYSTDIHRYPKSELAIGSYYTNWKPHISIINTNNIGGKIPADFIEEFKHASDGTPMGWFNLWSINKKNPIDIGGGRIQRLTGSISHLYISYSGQNIYVDV
jgi:hypothetical protein